MQTAGRLAQAVAQRAVPHLVVAVFDLQEGVLPQRVAHHGRKIQRRHLQQAHGVLQSWRQRLRLPVVCAHVHHGHVGGLLWRCRLACHRCGGRLEAAVCSTRRALSQLPCRARRRREPRAPAAVLRALRPAMCLQEPGGSRASFGPRCARWRPPGVIGARTKLPTQALLAAKPANKRQLPHADQVALPHRHPARQAVFRAGHMAC